VYQSILKEEIENYRSMLYDEMKEEAKKYYKLKEEYDKAKEERDRDRVFLHGLSYFIDEQKKIENRELALENLKSINRYFNNFKLRRKELVMDMVEMLVHFDQYEDLVDFYTLTEVIDFF
jgi:hypothetical protein